MGPGNLVFSEVPNPPSIIRRCLALVLLSLLEQGREKVSVSTGTGMSTG